MFKVKAQDIDSKLIFETDSLNWWKLDSKINDIEGTGWNRALSYLNTKSIYPKKQITIAILDSSFDLDHEAFANLIWENTNEIKHNSIDDDNNGYVDDVNGWNFLGTQIDGSTLGYLLMEKTRILKDFNGKKFDSLALKNKLPFTYEDVKKSYDKTIKNLKEDIKIYGDIEPVYTDAINTLKEYFKEPITTESLERFKTNDSILKKNIYIVKGLFDQGFPYKEFMNYYNDYLRRLKIIMNINYDNRSLIGDVKYDIKDTDYGSPYFNKVTDSAYHGHGTEVMGVIASSVLNMSKLKKRNQSYIKLMPLIMSGYGDFLDKDFYLSVKYAVDNGANIIVMSQSKEFSITPKVLKKAFSYAKAKGVLMIMSAGNNAKNLDKNIRFPHTISKMYKKDFNNLIYVGASTQTNDKNLIDEDSNYGKESVDIFAPGLDIPTTFLNNQYNISSGTSFSAPIVANVAALVWAHYPKLSAKKIKSILMKSGTLFDTQVNIPSTEDNEEGDSIPTAMFSELSKSGKVLNAYNALIMANGIYKKKN